MSASVAINSVLKSELTLASKLGHVSQLKSTGLLASLLSIENGTFWGPSAVCSKMNSGVRATTRLGLNKKSAPIIAW